MQHCADKQAYQVTRICKGRAVGVEKVKFVKAVTIFFFIISIVAFLLSMK